MNKKHSFEHVGSMNEIIYTCPHVFLNSITLTLGLHLFYVTTVGLQFELIFPTATILKAVELLYVSLKDWV